MRGHFEQGGLKLYKARQGYRNLRDPDNPRRGIVVPDEPRYTLIRKGFDLLLTGAYNVWQVAQILNDTWGYRTRQTDKQGGTPLRRTHAYQMFRDPFYAGFVRYKGEIRPGSHQPCSAPRSSPACRRSSALRRVRNTAPRSGCSPTLA
jgi:hypothetical protein